MSAWGHKYALLARRELWEHKSLWMAPLIVGGLLIVLPLLGGGGPAGRGMEYSPDGPATMRAMPALFGHSAMLGAALLMGGIACIAIVSYLLDTLYAERKDRSILFWKSLPVSDTETVLAKLLVALLLVPVLVLGLAAVVQPLLLGVTWLAQAGVRPLIGGEALLGGYRALGQVAALWLYGALWYAPLAGWLMLVSVLARRLPLMVAVVPGVAATVFEAMVFDTRHVATFIGNRLAPWTQGGWNPRGLFVGQSSADWSALYLNTSLWLGLAAAAVMVYIIIRLRRYRDDT